MDTQSLLLCSNILYMILKEILFTKFPTHVKISKTKSFKISTQSIYNAKLHHYTRSRVIEVMKEYVISHLPENFHIDITHFPIKLELIFYAPINWGSVRMSKGVINWKPAQEEYNPTHDLDNFAWIWSKVIQDCLVKTGIIPEDTVQFINCLEYKYQEVPEFEDRKILLTIIKS